MNMEIKDFRDLRVWQAGMDLVETVYRLTQSFPQQEVYGLTNQMRRAAVSVPSNIAEGHAREHTKEYLHFLAIAQASLAELATQLEISARLGYITPEQFANGQQVMVSLTRQLYALRKTLRQKLTPNP
jgi:four helix bundle protein